MSHTVMLYFLFLLAVGAGRLLEMRVSNQNRRALFAAGAAPIRDPFFRIMVALHVSVLVGCLLEVIIFERPFIAWLGGPALTVFILCNLLRWWVIHTLAGHWNVRVVDSAKLGVVTGGPYRLIRHPNYLAVFAELLVIPLVHTAILTAFLGTLAHLYVLSRRIRVEETVLHANPAYQQAMAHKARFIPGLF